MITMCNWKPPKGYKLEAVESEKEYWETLLGLFYPQIVTCTDKDIQIILDRKKEENLSWEFMIDIFGSGIKRRAKEYCEANNIDMLDYAATYHKKNRNPVIFVDKKKE